MSELCLLKPDDRLQYFNLVATETNIPVHMIEKDYWVVWVLQRLFGISELKDHLTFKGGTSLSKVYRLIKRFSEDIDLSIEKSFFGFIDKKSPDQASSRKQRNIILEKLSEKCSQYVQSDLLQKLKKDFSKQLTDSWNITVDQMDMYFPSAWAKYDQAKKGTLKLMPVAHTLSELQKDYRLMSEMFFEEPPSWDSITKAILLFEEEFNES